MDPKVQQGPQARRTAAPRTRKPAVSRKKRNEDAAKLLTLVLKSLEDDKAEDIVAIDLSGKTQIADHMVVASGRSSRHVSAIADHLMRRLKEEGFGTANVEGLSQADWVLVDGGDVIVHIFRPEVRDFYRIEDMWAANINAEQLAVN